MHASMSFSYLQKKKFISGVSVWTNKSHYIKSHSLNLWIHFTILLTIRVTSLSPSCHRYYCDRTCTLCWQLMILWGINLVWDEWEESDIKTVLCFNEEWYIKSILKLTDEIYSQLPALIFLKYLSRVFFHDIMGLVNVTSKIVVIQFVCWVLWYLYKWDDRNCSPTANILKSKITAW